KPNGSDLKQHTRHQSWEVATPSLSEGRIVYQLGADLHLYDIAGNADRNLSITLDSDFDQTRERWVKKPAEYLSAAHLSPHPYPRGPAGRADGARPGLCPPGQGRPVRRGQPQAGSPPPRRAVPPRRQDSADSLRRVGRGRTVDPAGQRCGQGGAPDGKRNRAAL